MSVDRVYTKDNMLVLGEGEGRFHATIGNVNVFADSEKETRKLGVLLTNIHDKENTFELPKDWFYNKRMVNLAKKNYNKPISFTAYCKRIVIKEPNGKLKFQCIWTHIKDIELGIN